jgi:hypothetical protein
MEMTRIRAAGTPILVVTLLVVAVPPTARAQTGILHKRTYAPASPLAVSGGPAAASLSATVSNVPAAADAAATTPAVAAPGWPDAVPGFMVDGVVVETPGSAGGAPGFVHGVPGHESPGFPGGAVAVPLPAPIGPDDIVHIMPYPYPFEPGGPPPVSALPEVDMVHVTALPAADGVPHMAAGPRHAGGGRGPQFANAAALAGGGPPVGGPSRAAPRGLPQPGARGLPDRAIGLRPQGLAAPGSRPTSPPAASATRGRAAANLQPVGVGRSAAPPRWRDRLRFSWSGGGG